MSIKVFRNPMATDDDALRAAEEFFHARIPLTRAMGVRAVARDARTLTLEAPVALNYNHLQTAFGGSINAVATLAAYGLLWLELRDANAHVVVAESTIRFLRAVRETIRASCTRPSDEELITFKTKLCERGKARIRLAVVIEENGERCAEFEGSFVAFTDRAPAPESAPG